MKKKLLLLTFFSLFFCQKAWAMLFGEAFQLSSIGTASLKRNHNAYWAAQSLSYTNGGITFNYPVGLFATPPVVTVAIENSGLAYSTSLISSVTITSNTATSTTIRVNIFTVAGGVTEAATGDFIVHLHALGFSPVS